MSILKNKRVLITGASSGLGYELAKELCHKNCDLFLTGRSCLKNIPKDIYSLYFPCDLTDSTKLAELIKECKKKLGGIDILINSAGTFSISENENLEDLEYNLELNVIVPFKLYKAFIDDMIENKWGRIVNIGSSSCYKGSKDTLTYCTSKHALLGFTRSLYDRHRNDDIKVFCISPGSMKTKMAQIDHRQDFSTFLDPKEVAKYISFVLEFNSNLISEELRLNRMVVK